MGRQPDYSSGAGAAGSEVAVQLQLEHTSLPSHYSSPHPSLPRSLQPSLAEPTIADPAPRRPAPVPSAAFPPPSAVANGRGGVRPRSWREAGGGAVGQFLAAAAGENRAEGKSTIEADGWSALKVSAAVGCHPRPPSVHQSLLNLPPGCRAHAQVYSPFCLPAAGPAYGCSVTKCCSIP